MDTEPVRRAQTPAIAVNDHSRFPPPSRRRQGWQTAGEKRRTEVGCSRTTPSCCCNQTNLARQETARLLPAPSPVYLAVAPRSDQSHLTLPLLTAEAARPVAEASDSVFYGIFLLEGELCSGLLPGVVPVAILD